jgi:L-lactate dehydrogenase complex protein LldE
MHVTLFIPCFVDALVPHVGRAVVEVLERLGHAVEAPPAQTCCGQPPFNAGYWPEARTIARHQLAVFAASEIVVTPSGSCAAMLRNFYRELFRGEAEEGRARELAGKTFEFSEFLVKRLGIRDVGARFPGRVTWHDGCHGLRELGLGDVPRQLLRAVRELELVEMREAAACCGFGGTFAVKFPQISTSMAEVKGESIIETGADYVVSNDSSCLLQIKGWLDRHARRDIRCLHLAEVLAHT